MNEKQQNRINDFIRNITNGPNRFLIRQPGEIDHKMVVLMTHIVSEVNSLVKDLKDLEDGKES